MIDSCYCSIFVFVGAKCIFFVMFFYVSDWVEIIIIAVAIFYNFLKKRFTRKKLLRVIFLFFFFANIVLLHYLVKYNNISYIHDVLIILEFF